MANYLCGEARYEGADLVEMAVFPLDPDPELEAVGHMQEAYLLSAEEIVEGVKAGNFYFASYRGAPKPYQIEVVVRNGKETLEVADAGQPEEFRTLRNLPAPG